MYAIDGVTQTGVIMRKVLYCIALTIIFVVGCDIPEEGGSHDSSGNHEYIPQHVELTLAPGNLSTDSEFEQVELPLDVTESYDLVPIQVGAFILDLNDHDPDYIRIEFSSDRIEWVGYSTDSADIYDSEEECRQEEDYCESVEVGKGESGYFEIQDGHVGIQNAYCRYAEESYSYTITAITLDLYTWPYTQVSDPAKIEISCQVID